MELTFMKEKCTYCPPQASLSEIGDETLICDSYNSGIDDYDYEPIDFIHA